MSERLKKTVMGIGALVALALGGAALAQAGGSGDAEKGNQAEERSESGEREYSPGDTDNVQFEDENGENGEKGDAGENGEGNEADESSTGAGADKAKAAALEATNGGKANAVERDQENGGTWEVEVTKPNGKTVDVRLDEAFKLLAVEADGEGTEGSR